MVDKPRLMMMPVYVLLPYQMRHSSIYSTEHSIDDFGDTYNADTLLNVNAFMQTHYLHYL
jgi:hypothetical protein